MTIQVLNGANLGRLGLREPEKYGTTTYDELVELMMETGRGLGLTVSTVRLRTRSAPPSTPSVASAVAPLLARWRSLRCSLPVGSGHLPAMLTRPSLSPKPRRQPRRAFVR